MAGLAGLLVLLSLASAPAADGTLPRLEPRGQATQLIVDGQPFLLRAGELHNSSASSLAYLEPIWPRLQALHLNAVLATVSWELLEPEEGRFDFQLVDGLVRAARLRDLRLVLLWFGTWKNGVSSYAPAWVKRDTARFPRCIGSSHNPKDVITPFSSAAADADARAFAALMRHLREIDGRQHTVVMVQVENEVGLKPETRDLGPLGEAAYVQPVPAELLQHLQARRETLHPTLRERWAAGGFRSSGTWAEVFGAGPAGDEVFMAWHYARYLERVASAGRSEYALPLFANAWLNGDGAPGTYPTGGPVAKMLDVWRAAAPSLSLLSPDIYLPDFKGVCAAFARDGNALFIPEAHRGDDAPGRACWAFGTHAALGFSPFGIEDLEPAHPLAGTYALLAELQPQILAAQSAGRIAGVYRQPGETNDSAEVIVGDWTAHIRYDRKMPPAGLILQTGAEDYLVAGSGFAVNFSPRTPGPRHGGILQVEEGHFAAGRWVPGRRLNGDETGANNQARLPPAPTETDRPHILRVQLYRFD